MSALDRVVMVVGKNRDGTQHVSTGCIVGFDLVLTCGHGIKDANSVKVMICKDRNDFWVPATKLACVFEDEVADGAILKLDLSDESFLQVKEILRELSPLDRKFLSELGSCGFYSRGYPGGATFETTKGRKLDPLLGIEGSIFLRPDSRSGRYQLNISNMAMSANKDWGGISGAPIFVDECLVGIIVAHGQNAKRTLWGISLEELEKNAQLQEFLGQIFGAPDSEQIARSAGFDGHKYRLRLCFDDLDCKFAFLHWLKPDTYERAEVANFALDDIVEQWIKSDLVENLDNIHSLLEALQDQKYSKTDACKRAKRLMTALIPLHPENIFGSDDIDAEIQEAKNRQLPLSLKIEDDLVKCLAAIKFPPASSPIFAASMTQESRIKTFVNEVAQIKGWSPSKTHGFLARQTEKFENIYNKRKAMRKPMTEELELKYKPLYFNLPKELFSQDLIDELKTYFQVNVYSYSEDKEAQNDRLFWTFISAFEELDSEA